jgi:hypothetical protein
MHHLVAFNILFVNTAFYMIEGTRKLCQDLCLILLIFFRNDTLSRTLCLELLFLNRYEAHKLVFSRRTTGILTEPKRKNYQVVRRAI